MASLTQKILGAAAGIALAGNVYAAKKLPEPSFDRTPDIEIGIVSDVDNDGAEEVILRTDVDEDGLNDIIIWKSGKVAYFNHEEGFVFRKKQDVYETEETEVPQLYTLKNKKGLYLYVLTELDVKIYKFDKGLFEETKDIPDLEWAE